MSDELVTVGRVGRPHGLDGSFVVERPSENEALFEPGATLYAGGEPVTVAARKRSGGRLVVKLDRAVERGTELAVPRVGSCPSRSRTATTSSSSSASTSSRRAAAGSGPCRRSPRAWRTTCSSSTPGSSLPMHEECVREVDLEAGTNRRRAGFADG